VRRRAGERRLGAVAVAVLLGLLGGCSRGDDDPTLDGEAPTTEASDTTTSTTVEVTSTTEPACPPVQRYLEDDDVEEEGDVDGDGRADFIQSYPTSDDSVTVTLLVDLAAGGGATLEVPSEHDAPTTILGAEVLDARSDGRDVLWVRVGAGASTTILGLYHLDGCSLEPATFENGEPVQLPIGGTVGTASGARCGSVVDPEADLLVYEATHISGREYEIVTTEYRWADGRLVRSPKSAPTVTRSDDVSEVTGFSCGDVSL
jgi:hypothetical protein